MFTRVNVKFKKSRYPWQMRSHIKYLSEKRHLLHATAANVVIIMLSAHALYWKTRRAYTWIYSYIYRYIYNLYVCIFFSYPTVKGKHYYKDYASAIRMNLRFVWCTPSCINGHGTFYFYTGCSKDTLHAYAHVFRRHLIHTHPTSTSQWTRYVLDLYDFRNLKSAVCRTNSRWLRRFRHRLGIKP
jgi:hypothetical protein